MRYKKKLLFPALAATAGLLAFTTGQAMADSPTAVNSLTSFRQMVVDHAGGHIFMSQGGTTGGIVVTDLSGNYVTTLDSGYGVAGLVLNGSSLYAALTGTGADADSIAVIDASSVGASGTATESYIPLGAGDQPASLAFQGADLWVSYSDTSNGSAGIGSIDSSDTFTPGVASGWSTAPDLAADPSDNGKVVAVGGSTAAVYTAEPDGSLQPGATSGSFCSDERQLAVVPGGDAFYAVCDSTVTKYSTADLSTVTSHPGTSVAVNSDGTAVAVGDSTVLNVYGDNGLLNAIADGSSVPAGGLSWDGTQLDALTGGSSGYDLNTFANAATTTPTFSLTPPAQAYEGYVPLKGTLSFSNGQLPSGSQVAITRAASDGNSVPVGTATVGSDGSFALTDTAAIKPGSYTYTASYPGVSDQSVTVTVAQNAVSGFTFNVPSTAQITQGYTLSGQVTLNGGSVQPGTLVSVTRTFGQQVKTFLAPVNPDGSFSLSQAVAATGTFTFTARYEGDPGLDIPASNSVTGKLNVVKMTPGLSVTGPTSYTYGQKIGVTVHLGWSTHTNRTVLVYAQTAGSTAKRLIKQAVVGSNGHLGISYATPSSTTFTVYYGGDAYNAPRTVTYATTMAGRVGFAMTGWYTSRNLSGITYRLYHQAGNLNVDASVGPNKYGECVWFEVQEFYKGAWHSNLNTSCASLSASSALGGYLNFKNADLTSYYRIRAHYLPPSTDVSNAGNVSGWQYLVVER